MGDPHLYQLSEHDMNKKQLTPVHEDAPLEVSKPKLVFLTNKAGAFANPLAEDESAWLKIGWYRV
jgi:hypothetical protein